MLKFTKMEGLGNDYVYMDGISQNIEKENELAKYVSDRHFGIGSDGLILILKSDVADFKMRMFNSDGSEAEMCGNGIRCVGKFVYDKGLTDKNIVTVETLAGIKTLKLNIKDNKVDTVKVDMGNAILNPDDIPVISDKMPVRNLKIKALDKEFDFTCVSMGNPHAITVVDNVDDFDVEKYGKLIEVNELFPNKTNVEFVEIEDENNIKMRVWERGAGETLACGTGACASAVSCKLNNLTSENVNVKLLGGKLNIELSDDNHVYMTGPAVTVFDGVLYQNVKILDKENEKNKSLKLKM